VYFLHIDVLLQMGCSHDTDTRTSAEEGYICDHNDRLRDKMTILYRGIAYAFPYPVFASVVLLTQLPDGLSLIYILFPENLLLCVPSENGLKLSMTGHTPIALSIVLDTLLLGAF
jgi:hypothetical protein